MPKFTKVNLLRTNIVNVPEFDLSMTYESKEDRDAFVAKEKKIEIVFEDKKKNLRATASRADEKNALIPLSKYTDEARKQEVNNEFVTALIAHLNSKYPQDPSIKNLFEASMKNQSSTKQIEVAPEKNQTTFNVDEVVIKKEPVEEPPVVVAAQVATAINAAPVVAQNTVADPDVLEEPGAGSAQISPEEVARQADEQEAAEIAAALEAVAILEEQEKAEKEKAAKELAEKARKTASTAPAAKPAAPASKPATPVSKPATPVSKPAATSTPVAPAPAPVAPAPVAPAPASPAPAAANTSLWNSAKAKLSSITAMLNIPSLETMKKAYNDFIKAPSKYPVTLGIMGAGAALVFGMPLMTVISVGGIVFAATKARNHYYSEPMVGGYALADNETPAAFEAGKKAAASWTVYFKEGYCSLNSWKKPVAFGKGLMQEMNKEEQKAAVSIRPAPVVHPKK